MAVPEWITNGGKGIVVSHHRWHGDKMAEATLKVGKRYVTTSETEPWAHALRFDTEYNRNRLAKHSGGYESTWFELIDPADTEYLTQLREKQALKTARDELKTAMHKCSGFDRQSVERVHDAALALLSRMED